MKHFSHSFPILFLLGAVILSGCNSLVDEDVTACGEDFNLDYELQLVTNMRTEIKTVLDLQADLQVATVLEDHLGEVFTDYAHDVDLSFYDTAEPMGRLEHFDVVMDGSQSSYSIFLPGRAYMHACAANLDAEPYVTLEGDELCSTARLVQHTEVKDTVSAHTTGIFTARKRMEVLTGVDQHFDVDLYMVNAATALILDMSDAPAVKDLKVYLTGFADGFNIADSTYTFNAPQIVRTVLMPAEPGSTERCYASVHFPSRPAAPDTKVIIDTDEPFSSESADEVLWEWQLYATMEDGSITKSILGSYKPLMPAQLKAVKAKVHANGSTSTGDPYVGASVVLDWEPGKEHDIEF